MLANRYSKEFMSSAVQKVLNRGSRSITEICNELGVSTASMYRWRVDFGTITDMKKTTRPQDRNVQDRLKSVIDYFSLPDEKRGEYLRKEGLHSALAGATKTNACDLRGINWVTPATRHANEDDEVLSKRQAVYEAARQKHPYRWSGRTRNWERVEVVKLNPGKEQSKRNKMLTQQKAA